METGSVGVGRDRFLIWDWGDARVAECGMVLYFQQEGIALAEQQHNGQEQARILVEGSSIWSSSNYHGGFVVVEKHGSGEIRSSCDANAAGSGDVGGASILSKGLERREVMSPGNAATLSTRGSVTCAMAACFSPGVTALHQTPGKDWLQDLDTANM